MSRARMAAALLVTLALAVAIGGLLVSVARRQTEAEQTYVRVVQVQPNEPNPAIWGQNFRGEYSSWSRTQRTAELVSYQEYGRYGGPEDFSRLEKDPALIRLFAGYPFALEYNEERGHAQAIDDVTSTKRLGDTKPGSCFTCKSSNVPGMMEQIGPEKFYATPMKELLSQFHPENPISCNDCHDAQTMALRVTRPAFVEAMAARGIDVSQASRQEMRSYVCGQCHVEYYFKGDGKYVVYPWQNGLNIDEIEAYYEEIGFKDWVHQETGAPLLKMQHPEFEMWSTSLHARAGVSCADCHMSYQREGGAKISDHWVRSPLTSLTNSCGTCHRVSEGELRARVLEVQDRTASSLQRAEKALLEAQDAINLAIQKGASDEALKEARRLHRRSFTRLDFVSAENSMGFHSPQEAARILGDAIDYARQAQIAARQAAGGQM